MKRSTLALLACAATMTLAGPVYAAPNLLVNGSFETGNFAGWTVTTTGGGQVPVVIAYNQAGQYPVGAYGESIPTDPFTVGSSDAAGNFAAYFVSDTANPHSITQTAGVALVAGVLYELGFDYYVPQNGYNNPFDASLSFVVGSTTLSSLTTGSPSGNTPPVTWRHFQTTYLATTTGLTNLSFNYVAQGVTAADFVVDRVYLSVAAVPEASTWAMMLAGFGAMGAVMRRRRTSVSFA